MSRRSSTSTPAVGSSRNRISGSCASALAIITRRFMPPDSVMILSLRLSHSDRSRSSFSMCAGSGAQPNSPRLKLTVAQTRLERVGGQLLRHQADLRARARGSRARCRARPTSTVPALGVTMPQTMLMSVVLPGAVRPEQREDLALADLEVDALQRRQTRGVGLGQLGDGDDRRHRRELIANARAPRFARQLRRRGDATSDAAAGITERRRARGARSRPGTRSSSPPDATLPAPAPPRRRTRTRRWRASHPRGRRTAHATAAARCSPPVGHALSAMHDPFGDDGRADLHEDPRY